MLATLRKELSISNDDHIELLQGTMHDETVLRLRCETRNPPAVTAKFWRQIRRRR